jgi:hypothetical protein
MSEMFRYEPCGAPIVTLKCNIRLFYVSLFILVPVLTVSILYVVQVIIAGSYNAGWAYNYQKPLYSIFWFYLSILVIIFSPTLIRILNFGNTYIFYENGIILEKYKIGKSIFIKYENIYAYIDKSKILVTKQHIPSLFINPIKFYIIKYVNGFVIPIRRYKELNWNYVDVTNALNIIKDRASVVIYGIPGT